MKTRLPRLLLGGFLLLIAVQSTLAFDYLYLSDTEVTVLGERTRWFDFDTLDGNIRTNDCFRCPFRGWRHDDALFIMSCSHWDSCTGYYYDLPEAVFSAPQIPFPDDAADLRRAAGCQGSFFDRPGMIAVISMRSRSLSVWFSEEGVPFDSLHAERLTVNSSGFATVLFFDCDVRISGTVAAQNSDWTIGASGDIRIDDNVMIEGTDVRTGRIPEGATSMIALVSEQSVILGNTPPNGRDNSGGRGRSQQDQDSTSVVITAMVVALNGSLTFAQQNDPGDSYRCGPPECPADERGTIHLHGAVVQRQHGYTHRSNNGGTGYRRDYQFDERLLTRDISFFPWTPLSDLPDEFDFGEVAVGETASDTVVLPGDENDVFSGSMTTQPFHSNAPYQFGGPFTIPIQFQPPLARSYAGNVHFFLNGTYREIRLLGTGIEPPTAQSIDVAIHPNPFNAATAFRLTLPEAKHVSIRLYDILGREAAGIVDQHLAAGEHRIHFDGHELAAGVYFARLTAGDHQSIHKLLLTK